MALEKFCEVGKPQNCLNFESLKQRIVNLTCTDEIIQEFIKSETKDGKINFYRVIFNNQRVEQSCRRPS